MEQQAPTPRPTRAEGAARVWGYVGLSAALTSTFLVLETVTWSSGLQLHTSLEIIATLVALFVGLVALVRYYTIKRTTILLIGTGFFGTALFDGFHALVTSEFFQGLLPSGAAPPKLIPWSWNASRTFLSILMILSWWAWQREQQYGPSAKITERAVYAGVCILTLASFLGFLYAPLPEAYYPAFVFGRPEELVAAMFFLAALWGYWHKGAWRTDAFEHWLMTSLIVGFLCQALFMSRSYALFDGMFDMAHLLKIVSYSLVLTGLLVDTSAVFAREQAGERRFRAAVEGNPNAILMADTAGQIVMVNQQVEKWFGYQRHELLGQQIEILVPAQQRRDHVRLRNDFLRQPSARGMGTNRYLLGQRKDGSEVPVEIALSPVETEEGLFVLVAIVDITERKRAEESSQRLASIVEYSQDSIVGTCLNGTIESWNAGSVQLFQYTSEEVIGQPIATLCPPGNRHEMPQLLRRVREGSVVERQATVWQRRDGSPVDVSLTISPVRNMAGEITGISTIAHDISAFKELQDSLEQRVAERTRSLEESQRAALNILEDLEKTRQVQARWAAELERSNKELDDFAYVASHDLRSPLRAIENLAKWIKEDEANTLSEQSERDLAQLRGRVGRMDALLNGLLQYSRIGRKQFEMDEVDCTVLMHEILELLNCPEGFDIDIAAEMPRFAAQKVPLEQVLRNLIDNAIKHHDRPNGRVAVTATEQDGFVEFTVSDDGPGIAAQYQQQVFEIFETIKTRDEVEGSGVGLALVKKTVETYGGTIVLDSAEGVGSTFRFTWPKL